jgi:hypothetical protein
MGSYSTTILRLPSINASFSYRLGTVIVIAGKVIPHSVDPIENGDRACFTWFMQDDIRQYLHLPDGKLSTGDHVMSATPPL